MKITSLTNARVKKIIRLKDRRARNETGLTLIEGVREVERALAAGEALEELYLCRDLLGKFVTDFTALEKARVPVHEVTPDVFGKMAFGDRREGLLAVCRTQRKKVKDIEALKGDLFIIIENVEKPGNLGAVLRTCDGAGVDAVFVCDTRADITSPNVIRASLGTVFGLNVVQDKEGEVLAFLKKKNARIVATSPGAERIYTQEDLKGPLAVVLGSEEKGLEPFWQDHSDVRVKVPMKGVGDSLNVSNTAAIVIYEVLRQRHAS